MKYRVDFGIKNMEKKREKIHILDILGSCVQVHLECVPVHLSRTQSVPVHVRVYRYTLGCTGTPCSVFPVSTSCCILAIT